MFVDVKVSGQIRQLAANDDLSRLASAPSPIGYSLAGGLDLVSAALQSYEHDKEGLLEAIIGRSPFLGDLLEYCRTIQTGPQAIKLECLSGHAEARSTEGIDSGELSWIQFLERYQAALRAEGFARKLSLSLASAVEEMADNIPRHSTEDSEQLPFHLVAWHVNDGSSAIAVIDHGIGILSSLTRNPKWSSISNDRDAIKKAVCENASSVVQASEGNGFETFTRNFLGIGGMITITSGSAGIDMSGSLDSKRATLRGTANFPGTSIFATCTKNGKPIFP